MVTKPRRSASIISEPGITHRWMHFSWLRTALKPRTEKTTMEAKTDVLQLVIETMMASLRQLFFGGLYEAYAIREPNPRPRE